MENMFQTTNQMNITMFNRYFVSFHGPFIPVPTLLRNTAKDPKGTPDGPE
jgi:hypothetical protein